MEDTRKPINKWLITIAVMLPTVMEIIDTSVANVALPHIQGSFNAGADEITWVLTSYLVSNAVVLPMTGWLGGFFGRKRFLISCITHFHHSLVPVRLRAEPRHADILQDITGRGRRRAPADEPGDTV